MIKKGITSLLLLIVIASGLALFAPKAEAVGDGSVFNGPHTIPGRVEAEDFNSGASQTAYYDKSSGNGGNNTTYRTGTDVDISTSGSDTYVTNIEFEEWLKYTVNVPTAGWYKFTFRASNNLSVNQSIMVHTDNFIHGDFLVTPTGGATTFATFNGPQAVYLSSGNHAIFIGLRSGNGSTNFNFDLFDITSVSAPSWQDPAIVTTSVTTEDVVVATVNAKNAPYNAAGNGTTDDTAAIQNALNDAFQMGGGIVFLPAGHYRVNGTLNVPPGITLRGEWKSPDNGGGLGEGTVLKVYSGKDNAGGTAFMTLNNISAARDLSFWYPEQEYDNVHAYPPTIAVTRYNNVVSAFNLTFYNAYKAITFGVIGSGSGYFLEDIYATCLNTCITIDQSWEYSVIHNVKINNEIWSGSALAGAPATTPPKATLLAYTTANAVGIDVIKSDGFSAYKIDISDVKKGMIFYDSSQFPAYGFIGKINATTIEKKPGGGLKIVNMDQIPETKRLNYTNPPNRKPASTTNFFNVKKSPYNAKGDGLTDDTTAIQSALDAANTAGGGTVFLPAGNYKITGGLTVWAGVELRGVHDARHFLDSIDGTLISAYVAAGNENGTPLIQIKQNAGIRGFSIRYPNSEPESILVYPWTAQVQGTNSWIKDIRLENSWNGFDLGSYDTTGHVVSGIWANAMNKGIYVGGGSNEGWLENVGFSYAAWGKHGDNGSWTYNQPLVRDRVYRYLHAFTLGDVKNEQMLNPFSFVALYGQRYVKQNGNEPQDILMFNALLDTNGDALFSFEAGDRIDVMGVNTVNTVYYAYGTQTFNGTANIYGGVKFVMNGPSVAELHAPNQSIYRLTSADSYNQDYEKPLYAVDGYASSKWVAVGSTPHWMIVDLNKATTIGRWVVKHANYIGGGQQSLNTRDFKLQYASSVIGPWTDTDTVTGNAFDMTDRMFSSATARYWRLYITSPEQGSGTVARIHELELYAVPTNLSLGKTATAISSFNGDTPNRAIDGNPASKWVATSGAPYWLMVDLGSTKTIRRWIVQHEGAYGGDNTYNTKSFKLQVGDSTGTTFTDVDEVIGNRDNRTDRLVNVTGRYFRLWITSPSQTNDTMARIKEFELYDAGGQIQLYSEQDIANVTNLAINKTTNASGMIDANTTPTNGVDGLLTNRWSSTVPTPHWLSVDLEGKFRVQSWVVKHAGAGGESTTLNAKDYKLQLSKDGVEWIDGDAVMGNTANSPNRNVSLFARYARLLLTVPEQGSGTTARVYEFELNGKAMSNLTPTATASADGATETDPPSRAIDGDLSSKWAVSGSAPHWLQLDLGSVRYIGRYVVKHAGIANLSDLSWNTRNFKFQGSLDGTNWFDVDEVNSNAEIVTDRDVTAVARYVRLYITAPEQGSGTAARIQEFEVYGLTATNIASGGTANASSSSGGDTPDRAIDGKTASKWATTSGTGSWLNVDLGKPHTIGRWVVKHAGAGGESATYNTKDFKLQVSVDNVNWRDVDYVYDNSFNVTDRQVEAQARYARLYIMTPEQGSGTAARIVEFEVYGVTAP
ncbi:discoidin domain-containing protein [Cohnella silvisoli]|uniref:Discoidin domain-containing protein n=1 Tax=Cohnella silvisoli TaxID=2873699 RepID=A0ABV1KWF9_9BACL|nr:discoidin domain-containing protein [Cohnella silvisoli]MCD9023736.1 discoidin domain-containing protein [Cohnella silvisoli]